MTQHKQTMQNKTTLVQSPLMTLGQEIKRAYVTMLLSPHRAVTESHSVTPRPVGECRLNNARQLGTELHQCHTKLMTMTFPMHCSVNQASINDFRSGVDNMQHCTVSL